MCKFYADEVFFFTKEVWDKDSVKVEILKPRDFSDPCVIYFNYEEFKETE